MKEKILVFLKNKFDSKISYETLLSNYIDKKSINDIVIFLEKEFKIKIINYKLENFNNVYSIVELIEVIKNNWIETIDQPIENNEIDFDLHLITQDKFEFEKVNFVVGIGDSCAPSNLIRWNNARSMLTWDSFIFDWSLSNMFCVCDIIENGLEWHIYNNIMNIPKDYTNCNFSRLTYPHHESNIEWKIKSAKRFFHLLETDYFVVFLHMTTDNIMIDKFEDFVNILLKKYPKLNFRVVVAQSINNLKDGTIRHKRINNYLDIFYCDVQFSFMNFERGNRNIFFKKLFKILVPYELDIKNI